MRDPAEIATQLFGQPYEALDESARKVARHVAERKHIARNLATATPLKAPTFGQRAADRVAAFGGSWTFVGLAVGSVLSWVALNGWLAARLGSTFDAYPYVLLNLFLSMLAAIQAPVILMSQNRQAEKDRIGAEHDYEVNLKAELEIMLLHDKLDQLRLAQWTELLALQKAQLERLDALLATGAAAPGVAGTGPQARP